MLRCDVTEESWMITTTFINGLRLEIKSEMKLHSLETLEKDFHKALEVERSYNILLLKAWPTHLGISGTFPWDRSKSNAFPIQLCQRVATSHIKE